MRVNLPGDEGPEEDNETRGGDSDKDASDEYFAEDLWP